MTKSIGARGPPFPHFVECAMDFTSIRAKEFGGGANGASPLIWQNDHSKREDFNEGICGDDRGVPGSFRGCSGRGAAGGFVRFASTGSGAGAGRTARPRKI